jgi:hypothetical protein
VSSFWYESGCKNGGMFIGGTRPMMEFLKRFKDYSLKIPKDILILIPITDQVIMNVMFGLGMLKDINFKFWQPNSEYPSLFWQGARNVSLGLGLGDYKLIADGKYALIIHLYDRVSHLTASVMKACPKPFLLDSPYIRNWTAVC